MTTWSVRAPDAGMADALDDIVSERAQQDEKWGQQNHALTVWLAILTEEVGEVAEAILHARPRVGKDRGYDGIPEVRAELVQVAAVALAALEYIDRDPEAASLALDHR